MEQSSFNKKEELDLNNNQFIYDDNIINIHDFSDITNINEINDTSDTSDTNEPNEPNETNDNNIMKTNIKKLRETMKKIQILYKYEINLIKEEYKEIINKKNNKIKTLEEELEKLQIKNTILNNKIENGLKKIKSITSEYKYYLYL